MACHALTHEISESRHRHLPVCSRSTSGTGYTCLQQQLTKHKQKTFASSSKKRCREKEREESKQKVNCKAFCVTCKHNNSRVAEHLSCRLKDIKSVLSNGVTYSSLQLFLMSKFLYFLTYISGTLTSAS